MKSISQALLWEMSRHWYWLVIGFFAAALFPFLSFFSLGSLGIPPGSPEMIRIHAFLMPFHFLIFCFGVIGTQGPVQRLYGYPLSNATIACWSMFSGIGLMFSGVALTLFWFNVQFQASWPVLGPALYFTMAFAVLQPFARIVYKTVFSILMVLVLAILSTIGFVTRYAATTKNPMLWEQPTSIEILVMVGLTIISSIALMKTIAIDRHGEDKVDRIAKMIVVLQKYLWSFWSSDKSSTTRLDGSVRAHAWYVWKLQGRSYHVMIAVMLILGSIVVLTRDNGGVAEFKPDPRMRLEPIMALWWMTLFAAASGLGFGMLNPDAVTAVRRKKTVEESLRDFHVLRMGTFQSSLPISNEQLSRAILLTIARGSITSIALSLFAFVVISIVKIDLVSGLWQSSFAGWYWLGLFFLPWAAMGCSATVCLFGRVPLVVACTAALVGIIVLVAIPSTQAWCVLSVSIASVLAVLVALAIGIRNGQLGARTVAVAIVGWVSLLVLSCLCSPMELTNWILSWLVLLATVAILPIIVMPVAIAFNRHR
ncbi:MAG: hypothetical protein ACK56W_17900 [Pirellula sp.]|jgi:hypothetical protein